MDGERVFGEITSLLPPCSVSEFGNLRSEHFITVRLRTFRRTVNRCAISYLQVHS